MAQLGAGLAGNTAMHAKKLLDFVSLVKSHESQTQTETARALTLNTISMGRAPTFSTVVQDFTMMAKTNAMNAV